MCKYICLLSLFMIFVFSCTGCSKTPDDFRVGNTTGPKESGNDTLNDFQVVTFYNHSGRKVCHIYIDHTDEYIMEKYIRGNQNVGWEKLDVLEIVNIPLLKGKPLPNEWSFEVKINKRNYPDIQVVVEDCNNKVVFVKSFGVTNNMVVTIPEIIFQSDSSITPQIEIINNSGITVCDIYITDNEDELLNSKFSSEWLKDGDIVRPNEKMIIDIAPGDYYVSVIGCEKKVLNWDHFTPVGRFPIYQGIISVAPKYTVLLKPVDHYIQINNVSDIEICDVRINNADNKIYGINWITSKYLTIGSGTMRRFQVPAGNYWVLAADCNDEKELQFPVTVLDNSEVTYNYDKVSEADEMFRRGTIYDETFRYRDSINSLKDALKLYGNSKTELEKKAITLVHMARVFQLMLDTENTIIALKDANNIYESIDNNNDDRLDVLIQIGETYTRINNYIEAENYLNQAFDFAKKTDDEYVRKVLLRIGILHEKRHELNKAYGVYNGIINSTDSSDIRSALYIEARVRKAHIDIELGNYDEAASNLEEMTSIVLNGGFLKQEMLFYNSYGELSMKLGDREKALFYYSQALDTYNSQRKLGYGFLVFLDEERALTDLNTAKTQIAMHKYGEASLLLTGAINTYYLMGDKLSEGITLSELARSEISQADYIRAENHIKRALEILNGLNEKVENVKLLTMWGEVHIAKNEYNLAVGKLEEAFSLHLQNENQSWYAPTYFAIGKAYEYLGNEVAAIDAYRSAINIYENELKIYTTPEIISSYLDGRSV